MKPKTLISGVSGFVGKKLAQKLLENGHHVIGADLRPCEALEGREGYRFQPLDLTDPASVNALDFAGLDNVIHLAAAGVKAAGRSWPLCTRVNIEGTANLVNKLLSDIHPLSSELARDYPGSSAADYPLSSSNKAPLFLYTQTWYEDHLAACPAFADNPYVATKHAASRWIETLASVYPAPVVIAKVFQVYGPGDDPNNVLSYAARCLKQGEPATFGSGTQLRDWIYIDDFINALAACLNTSTPGLTRYDLGTGQTHSLREMIELLASLSTSSSPLSVIPYPLSSSSSSSLQPFNLSTFQLFFDPSLDRGDTHITDHARTPPPGWTPAIPPSAGLSQLLTSIF